ncbi:hypothetical protein D3C81_2120370 [compost metagenome]
MDDGTGYASVNERSIAVIGSVGKSLTHNLQARFARLFDDWGSCQDKQSKRRIYSFDCSNHVCALPAILSDGVVQRTVRFDIADRGSCGLG